MSPLESAMKHAKLIDDTYAYIGGTETMNQDEIALLELADEVQRLRTKLAESERRLLAAEEVGQLWINSFKNAKASEAKLLDAIKHACYLANLGANGDEPIGSLLGVIETLVAAHKEAAR